MNKKVLACVIFLMNAPGLFAASSRDAWQHDVASPEQDALKSEMTYGLARDRSGITPEMIDEGLYMPDDADVTIENFDESMPHPQSKPICLSSPFLEGVSTGRLGISPSAFDNNAAQESKRVTKGIFTIEAPNAQGYAWQVNRWDACKEGEGARQSGWLAVVAKGNSEVGLQDNLCKQIAVGLPISATQHSLSGLACVLNTFIDTLNQAYLADVRPTGTLNKDGIDVKAWALLMKYGQEVISAFGRQADDQSNYVPHVDIITEDFSEDLPYFVCMNEAGAPIISIDLKKDSKGESLQSSVSSIRSTASTGDLASFSLIRRRPLQAAYARVLHQE